MDQAQLTIFGENIDDLFIELNDGVFISGSHESELHLTFSDFETSLDLTIPAEEENVLVASPDGNGINVYADKDNNGTYETLIDSVTKTTPGDVSGDGQVTAENARLALRAAVGLESYAEGSPEFLAADANHDGKIIAEDARLILRAVVGLETMT